MAALLERFAPGRPRPDLVFFTDDYVAFGGLLALAMRGVRVPDDVGVITLSNKGAAPIWSLPLSRIEVDPVADGEMLARHAIARIEGCEAPDPSWSARFVRGETIPHPARGRK